jgi:hypothetical protein
MPLMYIEEQRGPNWPAPGAMDFASFSCVVVIDSTLGQRDEVTPELQAAIHRKAGSATVSSFSVTHFDTNLQATTLLSTSKSVAAKGVTRNA